MTNEEYERFEAPFRELAMPVLEELRKVLHESGEFGQMTPVAVVDHDVSRGLGFSAEDDPELFVDLMLMDGAEYGYEGVGLMMTASTAGGGVIWSPGNFTDEVNILSPDGLKPRFEELAVLNGLSLLAANAWSQVIERRKDAPRE